MYSFSPSVLFKVVHFTGYQYKYFFNVKVFKEFDRTSREEI